MPGISSELKTTADSIRDYQRATYYAGTWDAKYERWVQMLAGLYRGPGREIVAWNAALIDDMAYTQPVFYEFEKISVPVLLMIGDKDNDGGRQESRAAGNPCDAWQLSGAGERSRGAHAACAAGRVSRSRSRAANPGARLLPQGAARRAAKH